MNLLLKLLPVFVAILLAATGNRAQSSQPSPCDFDISTRTLHLTGRTDAAMLACVQSIPAEGARTLRITSTGGDVETALTIAEILSGWDIHIVVEQQCNSSCANYILPVARRVTVRPGGVILLHGSIDAGQVARFSDPAQRAQLQRVADRQAEFAARHGIPAGWLLFRTEYSSGFDGAQGLRGSLHNDVPLSRAVGIIVGEALFTSCLPLVELDPLDRTAVDLTPETEAMRQRWARRGAYASGQLRCV